MIDEKNSSWWKSVILFLNILLGNRNSEPGVMCEENHGKNQLNRSIYLRCCFPQHTAALCQYHHNWNKFAVIYLVFINKPKSKSLAVDLNGGYISLSVSCYAKETWVYIRSKANLFNLNNFRIYLFFSRSAGWNVSLVHSIVFLILWYLLDSTLHSRRKTVRTQKKTQLR